MLSWVSPFNYCSYQNVLANSSNLISEQMTLRCLYYCIPIPTVAAKPLETLIFRDIF